MRHPYIPECPCDRCQKEALRRQAQSLANQKLLRKFKRAVKRAASWSDWHARGNEFDIQAD